MADSNISRTVFFILIFAFATAVQAKQEWAIEIPKGQEAAQKFASDNKLELIAEIIPGSNYFQFVQKSGRSKRSVHEIKKKILASDNVAWAAKQEPLESNSW